MVGANMSKFIFVLTLFFAGAFCCDAFAVEQAPGITGKHHPRGNKIAAPAGIGERYLKPLKDTGRFRAIALGNDGARLSPDYMVTDQLVREATVPNPALVPNPTFSAKNKAAMGASNNDSSHLSVIFVPAFLNRKIMEMTNSPEMYPTLTMSWKE